MVMGKNGTINSPFSSKNISLLDKNFFFDKENVSWTNVYSDGITKTHSDSDGTYTGTINGNYKDWSTSITYDIYHVGGSDHSTSAWSYFSSQINKFLLYNTANISNANNSSLSSDITSDITFNKIFTSFSCKSGLWIDTGSNNYYTSYSLILYLYNAYDNTEIGNVTIYSGTSSNKTITDTSNITTISPWKIYQTGTTWYLNYVNETGSNIIDSIGTDSINKVYFKLKIHSNVHHGDGHYMHTHAGIWFENIQYIE